MADSQNFFIFAAQNQSISYMTVVSAKEFHANSRYMRMARRGEHVMVRSRGGFYRVTYEPYTEESFEEEPQRDVTAEVCDAMQDWKAFLDGDESRMLSWEEFVNELQS